MTSAPANIEVAADEAPRWKRLIVWYAWVVAFSWLVAVPVFVRLTSANVHTDILAHAHLAKDIVGGGEWFSYSFWYPLIYLVSGGSESELGMRLASIGLLSGVVAIKSALVFWIAQRLLKSAPFAFAISMSLMLVMPLIDPSRPKDIYLGQVSANVWHNSTNILAAPFAIAAFVAGIYMLRSVTLKSSLSFSGLMVLSILAKPNYSLAFLPVLGITTLVVLWRSRLSMSTKLTTIAIAYVPSVLVLYYQYVTVYGGGFVRTAKLAMDPFAVWNVHSPNIVLSLVLSLAGPALVLLALPRRVRRDLPVVVSWVTLVIAIVQMAVFAEVSTSGKLATSGNWFWGSYTALTVVFLVSMVELVNVLRERTRSQERTVALSVAALAIICHVASGLYYVLNIGVPGYANY